MRAYPYFSPTKQEKYIEIRYTNILVKQIISWLVYFLNGCNDWIITSSGYSSKNLKKKNARHIVIL
jgi:hypothetical protein